MSLAVGEQVESDKRRKAQAGQVAAILAERYNLKKQWVIIAGDFNDTPGSAPLKPLLNNSDLFDALAVANVPPDQRWTYCYRGQKDQIDHVLVSRALKDKVTAAGVNRSGIAEIAKLTAGAEQPSNPCAASPTGATPPPTMARSGWCWTSPRSVPDHPT